MLMPVMIRPAMASPRTNLPAPSIDPWNSISWVSAERRFLASSLLIRPAERSASMDICLPGSESSANLAATSLMRFWPLVITMNWITTRTRKITIPTTGLPPTTNEPKVRMTLPASPSSRISRVDDTLSASRNSAVNSSTLGKVLNSTGRLLLSTAIRISRLTVMLRHNIASSISGGIGINITARMARKKIASRLLRCSLFDLSVMVV